MKSSLVLAPLALALLVACGGSQQRATRPAAPAPFAPKALVADSQSPKAGVVHISSDIRKACGIAEAEAHFAFDSASLAQDDRPVLTQLATCFISGPLKGREMQLVGHTDPRGGDDYNMVLGGSRADTIKAFLTMKGMTSRQIATTSRGELEARGTNEASWAEDRRVDVLLR